MSNYPRITHHENQAQGNLICPVVQKYIISKDYYDVQNKVLFFNKPSKAFLEGEER